MEFAAKKVADQIWNFGPWVRTYPMDLLSPYGNKTKQPALMRIVEIEENCRPVIWADVKEPGFWILIIKSIVNPDAGRTIVSVVLFDKVVQFFVPVVFLKGRYSITF